MDHRNFAKSVWESREQSGRKFLIRGNELRKVYRDGVAAVNNNTFCVEQGQVFGLLGPNGAGKSSMFNIMTMDLQRTSGDVKIFEDHIDQINLNVQGRFMGMCPQDNTIWDTITVDQSLEFMGHLKGLSPADMEF